MSLATREAGELQSAPGLPLGPESLTWQLFADHRMALLGPRAAVLQNMLPALGQGVEDHSVWFAETLARLARSIPPIFGTVYGPDPEATGHQVRDFHTSIKGTMPDGRPYSALNPETYYWAHATFVEHLVVATDTFIRPLGRAEKDQIIAESVTWFERYGVSARGIPTTWAAFEAYWDDALEHRLVRHRTAAYGVGYATKGWPRPARVPRPLWWLVRRPVNAISSFAHHRWPAAAGPRDPRPALGRRPRAPLPPVRPAGASTRPARASAARRGCGCTPSRPARSRVRRADDAAAPRHPGVRRRAAAARHRVRRPVGRHRAVHRRAAARGPAVHRRRRRRGGRAGPDRAGALGRRTPGRAERGRAPLRLPAAQGQGAGARRRPVGDRQVPRACRGGAARAAGGRRALRPARVVVPRREARARRACPASCAPG